MRALEHLVQPSRLGACQVGVGEQRVPPVPPRVVVGQHRLSIPFGAPERDDAGAHRRDVLEAIQALEEQVAGVEDLEMRGAGHIVRPAHPHHGHRAREWQPEVDLQRRGAIGDVAFGGASRFFGIARDGGIERIRGMFTIDVRTGERHARAGQMLAAHDRLQRVELIDPLPGVTERRHAVGQLPDGQPGIALDMEVQIDQARHDDTTAEIDPLGVRRYRRPGLALPLHRYDAIAANDDAHVVSGRSPGAIDQADVIEDDRRGRLRAHGGDADQQQRQP